MPSYSSPTFYYPPKVNYTYVEYLPRYTAEEVAQSTINRKAKKKIDEWRQDVFPKDLQGLPSVRLYDPIAKRSSFWKYYEETGSYRIDHDDFYPGIPNFNRPKTGMIVYYLDSGKRAVFSENKRWVEEPLKGLSGTFRVWDEECERLIMWKYDHITRQSICIDKYPYDGMPNPNRPESGMLIWDAEDNLHEFYRGENGENILCRITEQLRVPKNNPNVDQYLFSVTSGSDNNASNVDDLTRQMQNTHINSATYRQPTPIRPDLTNRFFEGYNTNPARAKAPETITVIHEKSRKSKTKANKPSKENAYVEPLGSKKNPRSYRVY